MYCNLYFAGHGGRSLQVLSWLTTTSWCQEPDRSRHEEGLARGPGDLPGEDFPHLGQLGGPALNYLHAARSASFTHLLCLPKP